MLGYSTNTERVRVRINRRRRLGSSDPGDVYARMTFYMPARSPITRGTLAALALSAVLAGCGSSSSSSSSGSSASKATSTSSAPAASPASGTKVSIAISNYAFKPADITVKAGTKLTFTNHDATAHTATSKTPGFDTGTIKPGASATVTVSKPGAFSYYCQFHAFMVAKVIVVQ
jgi:plastocyanin